MAAEARYGFDKHREIGYFAYTRRQLIIDTAYWLADQMDRMGYKRAIPTIYLPPRNKIDDTTAADPGRAYFPLEIHARLAAYLGWKGRVTAEAS
jgi:hypothetical protein